MRSVQNRVLDRHLEAIWVISSSRYVKWFVVGYTSRRGQDRFSGYRASGFSHFIVLADRLTKDQALNLERRLQLMCKEGRPCGPPYRRKYHPRFRELPYYESAGQGSPKPNAPIHSVYMAWIEP